MAEYWMRCKLCDEVVIVPRISLEEFRKRHRCSALGETEEVSE